MGSIIATTVVARVRADATSFINGMGKATASAELFGERMSGALNRANRASKVLTKAITVPLLGAGAASVAMAVKFETSMQKIVSLGDRNQKVVNGWKDDILGMAEELATAPQELAEALYFISSSGAKAGTELKILEFAAKGAAAGLGETQVVAQVIVSAMNTYGAANLSAAAASDILTKAVTLGQGEAERFAPTLGRVIPQAEALGISFSDAAAAIAVFTTFGLSADRGATQLIAMMSKLTKGSEKGEKVLNAVGTSYQELRTKLRDKGLPEMLLFLRDTLNTVGGSLKKAQAEFEKTGNVSKATFDRLRKGSTRDARIFSLVFDNVRALNGFLQITGTNVKKNAKTFNDMRKAAGSTQKAFEAMSDTTQFKLNKALAAMKVALIEAGTILLPEVSKAIAKVSEWMKKWANATPETRKRLLKLLGVLLLLGPALKLMTSMTILAGHTLKLGAAAFTAAKWVRNLAVSVMATGPASGSAFRALGPFGKRLANIGTKFRNASISAGGGPKGFVAALKKIPRPAVAAGGALVALTLLVVSYQKAVADAKVDSELMADSIKNDLIPGMLRAGDVNFTAFDSGLNKDATRATKQVFTDLANGYTTAASSGKNFRLETSKLPRIAFGTRDALKALAKIANVTEKQYTKMARSTLKATAAVGANRLAEGRAAKKLAKSNGEKRYANKLIREGKDKLQEFAAMSTRAWQLGLAGPKELAKFLKAAKIKGEDLEKVLDALPKKLSIAVALELDTAAMIAGLRATRDALQKIVEKMPDLVGGKPNKAKINLIRQIAGINASINDLKTTAPKSGGGGGGGGSGDDDIDSLIEQRKVAEAERKRLEKERAAAEKARKKAMNKAKKKLKDNLRDYTKPLAGTFKQTFQSNKLNAPKGLRVASDQLEEARKKFAKTTKFISKAVETGLLPKKYLTRANNLAKRADRLQGKLDRLIERMQAFGQTVVDAFDKFRDISPLMQTENLTGAGINQFFQDQLKKAQDFNTIIRQLTSMGLNRHTLEQLIASGPDAIEQARAFLSSDISAINAAVAAIADLGSTLSTDLQQTFFGPQIAKIQSELLSLATALDNFVKRMQEKFNLPGLAKGGVVKNPMVAQISENGPEAVMPLSALQSMLDMRPMVMPQGATRGGDGGTTVVYVTVEGSVVTENDLVTTIHRGLLRRKKRQGSLGLS